MMRAARNTETLVNFYQTTRRNNPEDSHLHTEIFFLSNSRINTTFAVPMSVYPQETETSHSPTFILFICSSFNDAVGISHCIALNDTMINEE
jgi:hypothetical protein